MTITATDLAAYLSNGGNTVEVSDEITRLLDVATVHVGSLVVDLAPGPVEQAILMYAARLYKRKESPFGINDFGGFLGTFDADIEALLAPYRRFKCGA